MAERYGKVAISMMMWLVLGIISIGTLHNLNNNNLNLGDIAAAIIIVVPLILALIGTIAIWSPEILMDNSNQTSSQKTKRSSKQSDDKLALLMEMMDEHEQAAFKESLRRRLLDEATITSDGELSVDDLFYEDMIYQKER